MDPSSLYPGANKKLLFFLGQPLKREPANFRCDPLWIHPYQVSVKAREKDFMGKINEWALSDGMKTK